MNRQQKRHPTHSKFPILQPSGKKFPPKKSGGKPDAKGINSFKKGKKGE